MIGITALYGPPIVTCSLSLDVGELLQPTVYHYTRPVLKMIYIPKVYYFKGFSSTQINAAFTRVLHPT